MKQVHFKDGSIICQTEMSDLCEYDAANRKSMAMFDGRGNIAKYSVADKWNMLVPHSWYSGIEAAGTPINPKASKLAEMSGKCQVIQFEDKDLAITIKHFLDENTNAVFTEYIFQNSGKSTLKIELSFGFEIDTKGYALSNKDRVKSYASDTHAIEISSKGIHYDYSSDYYFDAAFNKETALIERLDNKLYYSYKASIAGGSTDNFRIVISGGTRCDSSFEDVQLLMNSFDMHFDSSIRYTQKLKMLIETKDEKLKALFVSALNCALSSYKEIPETGFKGFFAGINYQSPARTYFRDGYWTVQAVLPFFPELVRNEIITLAMGVHEDGSCPSGVISSRDLKDFWSDHFDSPSYLIMMAYDYLCYTGDFEVLSEKIEDKNLIDTLVSCIDSLLSLCDENRLIVKDTWCRRDWADNVYRGGWVSYIEILFCRALFCMSAILSKTDLNKSLLYLELHNQCKDSINSILWNKDKNYYNNYMDNGASEDNLSLDTILALLYDVAPPDRKNIMLDKFEKLLETRNNREQSYGDWGVMCAYPPYKNKSHLVEKSMSEYNYHNGSDWPYLDGIYALVMMINNRDYEYGLIKWFDYSMEMGWFTPVEYYNPVYGKGSNLQAWSSMAAAAFVMGGYNLMPDIHGNINITDKNTGCSFNNVKLRDKTIILK